MALAMAMAKSHGPGPRLARQALARPGKRKLAWGWPLLASGHSSQSGIDHHRQNSCALGLQWLAAEHN